MGVAQTMEIPSVFADGYEKARVLDPALAHLLEFASLLGVELHRKDREGIMVVWRYAAHLIGVRDPLLFRSQKEGLRLYQVAAACEPSPDLDAIAMANCIVNSVPLAIGISAPKARAELSRYLYRVSRELIGDEADRQARVSGRIAVAAVALAASPGTRQASPRRALVNPSCNFSGSPTSVSRASTTCRTTSGPIDDNENRGPAGVLHLVMEQGATIAPSGGGHATIYAAAGR